MRKIVESTFVSLDGVFGDPMSWANPYFDEGARRGRSTNFWRATPC